ncbi:coiled-coil domain-containing protein 39 [Caerostris darwini]|uniref:Coiled-coil domain-containing protein 39 n=1 Tax=Caerostris darwini TaxID=1538125 RepID=A0AAV4R278_9ARAC|nr:coiled-coil domain-containing protein 39 [Caerostris darwini]
MLENIVDLRGYDLIWKNKPELPVANDENKKLEEMLKQRKIEVERLKIVLENSINKGKNIKEHFNDLIQTLNYKQQLHKSREHELEMEMHAEKVMERECSRLEQETRAINKEISFLRARQKQREIAIAEQTEKKENLKANIQWDEDALLQYLEKSAQMEKDNMALLKYTSEDDSKLNEIRLQIERLSKEAYDRKSSLDDVNTEVLIIQYIFKLRKDETALRHTLKEQNDLLSSEISRNNEMERDIEYKDKLSTDLKNQIKIAQERETDLQAQSLGNQALLMNLIDLSTVRNVLNNLLYLKQVAENVLKQLQKQVSQKLERIQDLKDNNKDVEEKIESLTKETFEAEYYTKELEKILHSENQRNLKVQREVDSLIVDITSYDREMNELKKKEKIIETHNKNCQAEIRNLNAKVIALDHLRTKQESETYEIESGLEKLRRRVQKMSGITNEEEQRRIEKERSTLFVALDDKRSALHMLTGELKLMKDKINVSKSQLEANKRLNEEVVEKIKILDFYLVNSEKTLKCCISRKQEFLVQECLERFQMKKYQRLLSNKNKSVASLQKNKLEFELIMKERTEELKHCSELLETELLTEEHECGIVKKKLLESNDRVTKLQTKY